MIQSQNVAFVEDLNANRAITITLDGGFSCDYSTKSGATTLTGMITTSGGSVI